MKRCFTLILNWFIQWVRKMEIEERIGFAIGGIIGIVVGITLFAFTDKVPATAMDYKPLENQMTAIQQNPDLLIETICDISIRDDVIIVSFSNDECKLTAKYNKNFELLSFSKNDNYTFWLWALVRSIFIGSIVYAGVSIILTLAVIWIEGIVGGIHNRLRSIKAKNV